MDKYEFKLKVDEMKALVNARNYKAAAEIAETINWRKVRNLNALVLAGEIFEQIGRYEVSKEILLMAYDKSPIGRNIIYRLAEIAIKTKNYDEAKEYYEEFVDIAPHDNLKYVLKYKMTAAQGLSYKEQIKILEELKEQEYSEEWAYELAYLYHRDKQPEKCVEACDELILWFGDGIYVEKALELKMHYQPLTKSQEKKYRLFRQKRTGIIEVKPDDFLESGEIINEAVEIPSVVVNAGKYNTANMQKELAKEMQQIINAKETEDVSYAMDNIKKLAGKIPYLSLQAEKSKEDAKQQEEAEIALEDEIDRKLDQSLSKILGEEQGAAQDASKQEDGEEEEPELTASNSIDKILADWEKTKLATQAALREADKRKLESAKEKALREAEGLMDRLMSIVPKLTAGMTPKELLEQEYLQGLPEQNNTGTGNVQDNLEEAGKIVAGMNKLLQAQIDNLTSDTDETTKTKMQQTLLDPTRELPELPKNKTAKNPKNPADMAGTKEKQSGIHADENALPVNIDELGSILEKQAENEIRQELQGNQAKSGREAELLMDSNPGLHTQEPKTQSGTNSDGDFGLQQGAGFDPEPGTESESELVLEYGSETGVKFQNEFEEGDEMNPELEYQGGQKEQESLVPKLHDDSERTIKNENRNGNADYEFTGQDLVKQPEQKRTRAPIRARVTLVVRPDYRTHVKPQADVPLKDKQEAAAREAQALKEAAAAREAQALKEAAAAREAQALKEAAAAREAQALKEAAAREARALKEAAAAREAQAKKEANAAKEARAIKEAQMAMKADRNRASQTPGEPYYRNAAGRADYKSTIDDVEEFSEADMEAAAEAAGFHDGRRGVNPSYDSTDEAGQTGQDMKTSLLTPEQKEVFSYFVPVEGMEEQIYRLLKGVSRHLQYDKHALTGNIVVEGITGSGKTVLIMDIIKALQQDIKRPSGKIGKIDASILNQKDVKALLKKVIGGCLIIESAGKISRETAVKLSHCMESEGSGTLYILEDTEQGIQKALSRDRSFAAKFTEKISIPLFTNDELVEFGRAYANDLDYDIDEMGILALYKRINNIRNADRVITLTEVKEIVDDAIDNAETGALKKVFGILTATRYNEDKYVILREKDFEE